MVGAWPIIVQQNGAKSGANLCLFIADIDLISRFKDSPKLARFIKSTCCLVNLAHLLQHPSVKESAPISVPQYVIRDLLSMMVI